MGKRPERIRRREEGDAVQLRCRASRRPELGRRRRTRDRRRRVRVFGRNALHPLQHGMGRIRRRVVCSSCDGDDTVQLQRPERCRLQRLHEPSGQCSHLQRTRAGRGRHTSGKSDRFISRARIGRRRNPGREQCRICPHKPEGNLLARPCSRNIYCDCLVGRSIRVESHNAAAERVHRVFILGWLLAVSFAKSQQRLRQRLRAYGRRERRRTAVLAQLLPVLSVHERNHLLRDGRGGDTVHDGRERSDRVQHALQWANLHRR